MYDFEFVTLMRFRNALYPGFFIDVERIEDDLYDFWLGHDSVGVRDLCFGVACKQEEINYFLDVVWDSDDDYCERFGEEHSLVPGVDPIEPEYDTFCHIVPDDLKGLYPPIPKVDWENLCKSNAADYEQLLSV